MITYFECALVALGTQHAMRMRHVVVCDLTLKFFPLYLISGFGGLGVACWPLVPKFAGSNPTEAVGFLGRKNPQHTFLRRE